MSIGKTLAAARARAGLSLAEVSEATCLRQTLITAIEQDSYGPCGGDFYARGHIRNLARVLGLDPNPLVAQFDAEHPNEDLPLAARAAAPAPTAVTVIGSGRAGTRTPPATRPADAGSGSSGASRGARPGSSESGARGSAPARRSAIPALGGLLALLLAFGLGRVLTAGDDVDQRSAATTRPARVPAAAAPAPPPGTGDRTGEPRRAERVTVQLDAARGRSWVSVTNRDGKTLYEGTLDKGAQKTFTDRDSVRLVVGNSGAVDLVVNGKDLGAPGKGRTVARAEFDSRDYVVG